MILLCKEISTLHLLPASLVHLHLQIIRHCIEELRPAHEILICDHLVKVSCVLFYLGFLHLILLLCFATLDAEAHFGKLVHRQLSLGLHLPRLLEE